MTFKVAIVNTLATGGAATAAIRLHLGLRVLAIDSNFINSRLDASPSIIMGRRVHDSRLLRASKVLARWLRKEHWFSLDGSVMIRSHSKCESFSDCRVHQPLDLSALDDADVLNLHWGSDFVDLPSFFERFAGRKPIVWTLHDMNAFTGGCHYDSHCGRYLDQCGQCPMLLRRGAQDASSIIWQRKRVALDRISTEHLHIVTPSEWLSSEAKKSTLLNRFDVTTIPYGLDTSLFRPVESKMAREILEIPQNKVSILFVADVMTNYRKGFDLLSEAIESICKHKPELCLVSIGGGGISYQSNSLIKTIRLGHVANPRLLSVIYSAADLLVIPSRQDNLPNTVIESMACGTPVAGFGVGGISEMVRDSSTGWLTNDVSVRGLAETLLRAIEDIRLPKLSEQMGLNCRNLVKSAFTGELQAMRYKELFQKQLSSMDGALNKTSV